MIEAKVKLSRAFNLDNLIAWLKTKDPEETYSYISGSDCVFAQYFRSCGLEDVEVRGFDFDSREGRYDLPSSWVSLPFSERGTGRFRFGVVLYRAKKLKKELRT